MSSGSPPAESSLIDERAVPCPRCNYDLRALAGDVCPECGLEVGANFAAGTLIPFAHRKLLGFWRAYWKTVLRVTFKPRRFALHASQPVDYGDARLFQHVTVLLASLAVAGLAIIASHCGYAVSPLIVRLSPASRIEPFDIAAHVVLVASIWLFFFLLTGLNSYFFHPAHLSIEQQNRAVAMSYYASGPVVWIVGPSLLLLAAILLQRTNWVRMTLGDMLVPLVGAVAAVMAFFTGFFWLMTTIRFSEGLLPRVRRRMSALVLIQPIVILAALGVSYILVPLVYFLVVAFIDSLRA